LFAWPLDGGVLQAQHERQDNCFLRAENDKIRCENIAMREALRNVICPTCGGPPVTDDYFDEQKLRMENARLKEEASRFALFTIAPSMAPHFTTLLFSHDGDLARVSCDVQLDRVSSLTSKYLGRPITQLPPVQPLSMSSSLDLSVGGLGSPALGPSLDLDLLSGGSSGYPPFHLPMTVSELERPMMAEMATRAMDELIRMAQAGEHLWVKTAGGGPDGREVLNVDTYDSIFAKPGGSFRGPDVHVEGSRDSGLVFMSAIGLVDMFMDSVTLFSAPGCCD
jgi:homeobox-leucine zipper protein